MTHCGVRAKHRAKQGFFQINQTCRKKTEKTTQRESILLLFSVLKSEEMMPQLWKAEAVNWTESPRRCEWENRRRGLLCIHCNCVYWSMRGVCALHWAEGEGYSSWSLRPLRDTSLAFSPFVSFGLTPTLFFFFFLSPPFLAAAHRAVLCWTNLWYVWKALTAAMCLGFYYFCLPRAESLHQIKKEHMHYESTFYTDCIRTH